MLGLFFVVAPMTLLAAAPADANAAGDESAGPSLVVELLDSLSEDFAYLSTTDFPEFRVVASGGEDLSAACVLAGGEREPGYAAFECFGLSDGLYRVELVDGALPVVPGSCSSVVVGVRAGVDGVADGAVCSIEIGFEKDEPPSQSPLVDVVEVETTNVPVLVASVFVLLVGLVLAAFGVRALRPSER